MNIKVASKLTGVSEHMLRHYEKKGLVTPNRNKENNYRDYTQENINTIVMIKQYSELGISLKSIYNFIHEEDTASFTKELDDAIIAHKNAVEWSQARLYNSKDFRDIFTMIEQKKEFMLKDYPEAYYYPRIDSISLSLYSSLYHFGGAVKTIFRIEKQNIEVIPYPVDQGMLSFKKLDDPTLTYIEIPAHKAYCTYLKVIASKITDYSVLKKSLNKMKKNGYSVKGDIYLYQIMSEDKDNKITICIECDVG